MHGQALLKSYALTHVMGWLMVLHGFAMFNDELLKDVNWFSLHAKRLFSYIVQYS